MARIEWAEVKRLCLALLQLSWANVLTFLAGLVIPTTSTFFLGHLNPVFMGSATIGNMIMNASGMSIGIGISLALDSLCSQANGAKKYKLVGLYCQRSMAILTLACIPILAFLYNTQRVLDFAGLDQETSQLASSWVKIISFGLWPSLMNESYKRYLNGMKVVWPQTAAVVIVGTLHVLNAWFIVEYLGKGFEGAAVATAISMWLMFFFTVVVSYGRLVYLRRKAASGSQDYALIDKGKQKGEEEEEEVMAAHSEGFVGQVDNLSSLEEDMATLGEDNGDPLHTWPSPSRAIFKGWIDFLKLGVPAAASLFVEWGSWEVNALFTSRLGKIPLASHSIMALTSGFWYSTPLGISVSASSLVGNALGANDPHSAKLITIITYFFSVGIAFFNGAAGLLYRVQWGAVFTYDSEVINLVGNLMFIMWLYTTVDALKCVGMAILRGCGRPMPTVWGNVFSCLLAGYPLSIALGFYADLGIFGIWIGMCFAWLCAGSIYLFLLYRTDWQHEADLAAERMNQTETTLQKSSDDSANEISNGTSLENVESEAAPLSS